MSDKNSTDNVHVTDEPLTAAGGGATTDNVHVTDEPLTATAKDDGTATPDNVHVTDEHV
jgi:hypothetical protein